MKVFVIGGGASGMMAAISAAQNGADVTLIEKNEKLGKKLYITGKGRCNITNCTPLPDFFNNIVRNAKFLQSSIYQFDNNAVYDFFENNGVSLKKERGNRVFPVSDKSNDIINGFIHALKKLNVKIKLNEKVINIENNRTVITKIITDKSTYLPDKVIIATGGKSYSSTGSTGDGYIFAEKLGHKIEQLRPSLIPIKFDGIMNYENVLVSREKLPQIEKIALKNVGFAVRNVSAKKEIYRELGEITIDNGVLDGPLALTASAYINRLNPSDINLCIDLKPALDEQKLDARICKDFLIYDNKQFRNSLKDLLPSALCPIIITLSGIDSYKIVNTITKEERTRLVKLLKNFTFNYKSLGDFDRAIITSGGISVKEIEPKTMRSKILNNLYFVGEILDVDALTGGFNLQLALSTGYAAGAHIKEGNI